VRWVKPLKRAKAKKRRKQTEFSLKEGLSELKGGEVGKGNAEKRGESTSMTLAVQAKKSWEEPHA